MKSAKGDALAAVDTAVSGLRCADRALLIPTPHCVRCSGVVLTAHLPRRILGQLLSLARSPSLHRESFSPVWCLQVWLPRASLQLSEAAVLCRASQPSWTPMLRPQRRCTAEALAWRRSKLPAARSLQLCRRAYPHRQVPEICRAQATPKHGLQHKLAEKKLVLLLHPQ